MPLDAPLLVRNAKACPVVFSDPRDPNNYIEFQGAGDPSQGDVQIVPGDIGNTVSFRRALGLGILTVEKEQADIDAVVASHREEWEYRESQRSTIAEESISREADNDIAMVECIGPAMRPGEATCGVPLPIRADALAVEAPLCQAHKHLAGQFEPRKTGAWKGNREEVVWVRAAHA